MLDLARLFPPLPRKLTKIPRKCPWTVLYPAGAEENVVPDHKPGGLEVAIAEELGAGSDATLYRSRRPGYDVYFLDPSAVSSQFLDFYSKCGGVSEVGYY